MNSQTMRIVRFVAVLLIVIAAAIAARQRSDAPQEAPAPPTPAAQPAAPRDDPPAAAAPVADTTIEDVTVRDLKGDVAYAGDVELAGTLARIDAGERLRFRQDGSVFQNRERRLPAKASGYYREWVHPTPGLDGPGPQRVVTGQQGEAYYTPDHYRTFQRVR